MVKLDPETPVYRAFDDQRTLLFFGDGSAAAPHPGDADIYRRLRYVTMDLAMTQVRTERHERVNGWVCENQSRNLAGRAVVIRVLETDDPERGGERSDSGERRDGDEGRMMSVGRDGCESRGSWANKNWADRTTLLQAIGSAVKVAGARNDLVV